MIGELKAMQAHRQTLVQLLRSYESSSKGLMQGSSDRSFGPTDDWIASLKAEIANLERSITEDGGTLDG